MTQADSLFYIINRKLIKMKINGEKTSGGATGLFYEGSINN